MILALLQRVTDWRRERRIERLSRALQWAHDQGRKVAVSATWKALRAEVNARSPQQVLRMEIKQGLR